MSATIHARGVGASVGDRDLFTGLDLVVAPGDVVGLVGPNGSGKSTALRILAGLVPPRAGEVRVTPETAAIGFLPQEPECVAAESVRDYLARRTGVAAAQAAFDEAALALERGDGGGAQYYSHALERWLALGAADFDDRAVVVVRDLGLDIDLRLAMTELSGGQAARAALAALRLARFDGLLLDEPTNDLDRDGLQWLEEFVSSQDVPVVVVSHDREFLSRTVTTVVELDQSLRRTMVFGGGYDAYVEERSVARRRARLQYEEHEARRSALEARARRQRAWLATGVKNTRQKATDNDKIGRKFRAESTEKQAAKARQLQRQLDRLDPVAEPRKEWQLQFTIAAAPRSGEDVIWARSASISRGGFQLGPVDLHVGVGDRVVITGPNGGGKSTLLALLLGRLTPTSGQVDIGSGVVVGEIDQARSRFDSGATLLDAFGQEVNTRTTAEVRTLLAKFGLGPQQVLRATESLSPGERTRAALALLQARGVNLLVLDEPSNHLDLPAIEELEEALEQFGGTLLLVTHDRRLQDIVRLTRRWHVEGGVVTEVPAPE